MLSKVLNPELSRRTFLKGMASALTARMFGVTALAVESKPAAVTLDLFKSPAYQALLSLATNFHPVHGEIRNWMSSDNGNVGDSEASVLTKAIFADLGQIKEHGLLSSKELISLRELAEKTSAGVTIPKSKHTPIAEWKPSAELVHKTSIDSSLRMLNDIILPFLSVEKESSRVMLLGTRTPSFGRELLKRIASEGIESILKDETILFHIKYSESVHYYQLAQDGALPDLGTSYRDVKYPKPPPKLMPWETKSPRVLTTSSKMSLAEVEAELQKRLREGRAYLAELNNEAYMRGITPLEELRYGNEVGFFEKEMVKKGVELPSEKPVAVELRSDRRVWNPEGCFDGVRLPGVFLI